MAKKDTGPVEKSIGSAMAGTYQSTVVIPPGRRVHHEKVRHTTPPDTREQIIRIYNDADPVGFLMDIVNGKMIEKHEVREDKEGVMSVHTTYEQPNMNQRIKVATYLAEKYMPRLAVVNHRHMHTLNPDGDKPGAGQRNFAQIVNEAARRVGSGEDDD